MDKKYGFYLCSGCGIGEALDLKKMAEDVLEEEGHSNIKFHDAFCSPEGVAVIQKDIDDGVNAICIAACSRRVLTDVFNFPGCLVDRVNLREQVVWAHPGLKPSGEKAEGEEAGEEIPHLQMMGEDYLRMGMKRLEKINLPEPYKLETLERRILVIGGGVTGMTAALDAAEAGYDVTIVEKEDKLGGWAANVRKQLPLSYPYQETVSPIVDEKIRAVQSHSKIEVKTGTVVARIAGQPGDFTVTFKKPGEEIEFDVPYPLPDEMKVDENGKELDNETLAEKFKEYNEGRRDIRRRRVRRAGIRENPGRGDQRPVREDGGHRPRDPALGWKARQERGVCPEPGRGRRQGLSLRFLGHQPGGPEAGQVRARGL